MANDNSTKNKPLSTTRINALKPSNEIGDTGENAGLRISCTKSGVKTFFYRYRSPHANKIKRVTIGVYIPDVRSQDLEQPMGKKKLGLSAARQVLVSLKADRKAGICPATRLKEENRDREQQEISQRLTMKALVEVYLSQHIEDHLSTNSMQIKGVRKLKGQKETRRTLEAVVGRDAPTDFGNRLAIDVTHIDIKNLISSIIARGSQVQAGRVLAELNLAFGFVIGRPEPMKNAPYQQWKPYLVEEYVNPCLQAKAYFKRQKTKLTSTKGKRAFDDNEIRLFLEWLPISGFSPISRHALMISILTGVRTGEVVGAVKTDFNLLNGTWFLKDTKTYIDRYVQLSRQAIEYLMPILEDADNTTSYLLPSSRTGKPQWQKQLSEQAWHIRKHDRMLNIPHWTAHDLRRTCRTGLARLKCPGEVGEAILGHTLEGIEGTYNLHRYEEECAFWLQKWADHLDILLGKASNVVAISRRRV
jgi:integrase